jgi:hypothetical protein
MPVWSENSGCAIRVNGPNPTVVERSLCSPQSIRRRLTVRFESKRATAPVDGAELISPALRNTVPVSLRGRASKGLILGSSALFNLHALSALRMT